MSNPVKSVKIKRIIEISSPGIRQYFPHANSHPLLVVIKSFKNNMLLFGTIIVIDYGKA
jgi:hypothetical protein